MWCLAMLTHVYHIRKLDPVYATLHRVAVYWTLLTVNPLEKLSKKIGKTKSLRVLDFTHGTTGPYSRDSG